MRRATSQPRAVVADGRPLERSLVRFLLGEAGYAVVAEAGAAHDTEKAVREYRPDVVVLNENVAGDQAVPVIANLRLASPGTKIILVTSSGRTAPTDLVEEADAVIEEGAGIKELGFALASTRQGTRTQKARVQAPLRRPSLTETRVPTHLRWLERLQGAVAASILIIAVAMFVGPYGNVPSGPDGNREARVHLSAAFRSLDELAERASTADPSEVGSLAAALWTQRALVLASGGDVSDLDQEIATTLQPLVPSMSPEAATTLLAILDDLLPGSEPPSPPPTVEPTSTPEPSPQPDQTTTQGPPPGPPVPTETPVPAPEPSETPPPVASETPPPSPNPEPSETPPAPEPEPSHTPPPRPTPSETPPSPEPTPSESPSPSPEPSPSETPSPSPEPSPSESPSPTPTETPSPTPSETPSPSPTESPSPSPEPTSTDTPSPSPEPTQSESPSPTTEGAPINPGLIVVPPGIGVLVAVSRRARRRRSQRGPVVIVNGEGASSQTHAADFISLKGHVAASKQNVYDTEELRRRLTTVREAIEEQSIRAAELEEQFKSELRRVQMLRAFRESPPSH